MANKILVDYSKLINLRNEIDTLLQKDNHSDEIKDSKNIIERKEIDAEYELDSVDNKILDYISKNPGTNKENLVRNLVISSRVPILNKTKRLEKFGYIIANKDEKNSQTYKLYYNDENSISVLIRDLNNFNKSYITLIDSLKDTIIELNNKCKKQNELINAEFDIDNYDFSCSSLDKLTQNILLPFKNLIVILFFSNFISFNIQDYKSSIIRKFTIINAFVKNIIVKIISIFPKNFHRTIDSKLSVIDGLEVEMLPSTIENNINFFRSYNLNDRVEYLWELVWKIVSPFLSKIFNFYAHIEVMITRNSINGIKQLLEMKKEYKEIERHYQYK